MKLQQTKLVTDKVAEIKEQVGIDLTLCEDFAGIHWHKNKRYFNVITEEPVHESKVYDALLRLTKKGVISSVEPNGVKRLAIFI